MSLITLTYFVCIFMQTIFTVRNYFGLSTTNIYLEFTPIEENYFSIGVRTTLDNSNDLAVDFRSSRPTAVNPKVATGGQSSNNRSHLNASCTNCLNASLERIRFHSRIMNEWWTNTTKFYSNTKPITARCREVDSRSGDRQDPNQTAKTPLYAVHTYSSIPACRQSAAD